MPTAPEAAAAAEAEAAAWAELADRWRGGPFPGYVDTPGAEAPVLRFFDPASDLAHRGESWGYQFTECDLADVCRFAAGLATAEGAAWGAGERDIATRAYSDRRFLLSDRVLHWAVPWLDAVGRCYPPMREDAHSSRDRLLDLGDRHRPAPDLADGEGIYQPGHDAFGPLVQRPITEVIGSLWSGLVILGATLASITGEELSPEDVSTDDLARHRGSLGTYYEVAAARWARLGRDHPGSGALWRDLSRRADVTAKRLKG